MFDSPSAVLVFHFYWTSIQTSKRHRSNVWISFFFPGIKRGGQTTGDRDQSQRITRHSLFLRNLFFFLFPGGRIGQGAVRAENVDASYFPPNKNIKRQDQLTRSIGKFQPPWVGLSRSGLVQSAPCRCKEAWQLVGQFRFFRPILLLLLRCCWSLSQLNRSNLYSLVIGICI